MTETGNNIRKGKRTTPAVLMVASLAVILIVAFSSQLVQPPGESTSKSTATTTTTMTVQTITTPGKSCTDPSLPSAVVRVE